MHSSRDYLKVFRSRNISVLLFLGFSSGLPLVLTSGTLQAWMTVDGVDLRAIGLFSLVGLPYTLKFLWSPIMDRFVPPLLGRRRGWIVITQIAIMLGIVAMSLNSPRNALWLMGVIALIVAFMLYMHGLTFVWNLGFQNFKMSAAMLPFLGILFIFIGYMLRQAKRNWFIGIRTPWTLSSDSVWDKTHQLGSILFMVSGAFAIFGGLFGGMIAFWLLFVPLIGSTLFLVIYSYILYRDETRA